MNKFCKYVLMALAACGMTACVQDLNTTPIDKNSASSFNQDAAFTKCYATLATTGQKGAAGSGDIDDLDEGTSAFYRLMWELNEFGTDEGWWIWNDVGLADIRVMNWNGDNALVKGLYYRFNIDVMYCNHFLAYTEEGKDAKTDAQRAEVRFLRALNWWYMLDLFYLAPFNNREMVTEKEEINRYPEFYTRDKFYTEIEKELVELTTLLPATRITRYRVDQTAAWLLLARLYLNADVYNKDNKDWVKGSALEKAKNAAEKALAGNYNLHQTSIEVGDKTPDGKNHEVRYSAYQQLFMADNDINGAAEEAVMLVYQDGNYCISYGDVTFVIAATRDAGMVPWGVSTQWKCFRSSPELVTKFVDKSVAESIYADEYEMPAKLADDRAIFCSGTDSTTNKWKLGNGGMDADFYVSWACPKFTSVYSSSTHPAKSVGSNSEWPDTDIPLMRIAEAYMIKAEVLLRQGDAGSALDIVNNIIRKRANAAPLASLDEETMLDEWAREFWGEGRRRTDLIRFDRFAGPQADAAAYHWEGRNGKASASGYKSAEEKWNWYPVPSDDKKSNPKFKDVIEKTGLPGGDGYTYAN